MKKSNKLQPILLLLLLSAISLNGYAQTVIKGIKFNKPVTQSSNHLGLNELKEVAGYLNELEFLRIENKMIKSKVVLQERIIFNKDNIIGMYESKEQNWRNMIDDMKVPWYNRFWIGATVVAVLVSGIYVLTN